VPDRSETAPDDVELVLDAKANLGEGPVWDDRTGEVVWVDIMAHAVHRFDPRTGADRVADVGQPVGAVALRAGGGLVLALQDGFATLADDGSVEVIAPVEADRPDQRMNDGKPDRAGRFWAGTMSLQFTPGESTLYRLDADHLVTPMVTGMTLSNGLGWSPDDTTFYLTDTMNYRIDAYDYDAQSGTISARRRLIDFDRSSPAFPDGLAVDAEGYLWVAMYAGSAIRRYAPDGSLEREIRLPVSQPTCVAFGGPDYRDLYISTANQELDAAALARQPTLGGLFRFRPGVAGLPPNAYTG
jgi:sugar lactone lactonase YvrE